MKGSERGTPVVGGGGAGRACLPRLRSCFCRGHRFFLCVFFFPCGRTKRRVQGLEVMNVALWWGSSDKERDKGRDREKSRTLPQATTVLFVPARGKMFVHNFCGARFLGNVFRR